mmetsp:Transcript_2235/g.3383  ORF Transcript_2235/g.3383 Transcript_2235/m.3383 type:complete len:168 (+) Transcript_2235:1017-1520(+)
MTVEELKKAKLVQIVDGKPKQLSAYKQKKLIEVHQARLNNEELLAQDEGGAEGKRGRKRKPSDYMSNLFLQMDKNPNKRQKTDEVKKADFDHTSAADVQTARSTNRVETLPASNLSDPQSLLNNFSNSLQQMQSANLFNMGGLGGGLPGTLGNFSNPLLPVSSLNLG